MPAPMTTARTIENPTVLRAPMLRMVSAALLRFCSIVSTILRPEAPPMKSALFSLLFGCLLAGSAATAQQKAPASRTAQIYVGVVDGKGAAVPGLTARDFAVREDGAAREVLRAEPATESLDIMLIVDDSQ